MHMSCKLSPLHNQRWGQREEALEKAGESYAIYKQLVKENPHAFNSALARSLTISQLDYRRWL